MSSFDQAVSASRLLAGGKGMQGLVNAVLRNFIRQRESLVEQAAGWRYRTLFSPAMVDRQITSAISAQLPDYFGGKQSTSAHDLASGISARFR
jgi:hypothetical protein